MQVGEGVRIIPARAGFTPCIRSGTGGPRDHPRSRGVYSASGTGPGDPVGSSPLARGLPGSGLLRRPGRGIIPARAGFTSTPAMTVVSWRDHPRSRGVYGHLRRASRRGDGSSPLARGLPRAPAAHWVGGGIIPARAGFTVLSRARARAWADHPRSRGVYADAYLREHDYYRIIPARAGFTTGGRRSRGWGRDHPRSRGVYPVNIISGTLNLGSSPLARGLLGPIWNGGAPSGIIPARAGFTPGPAAPARVLRDHPRSRGVYASRRVAGARVAGSSPLARGLPR